MMMNTVRRDLFGFAGAAGVAGAAGGGGAGRERVSVGSIVVAIAISR
jgi:hypothetical protein